MNFRSARALKIVGVLESENGLEIGLARMGLDQDTLIEGMRWKALDEKSKMKNLRVKERFSSVYSEVYSENVHNFTKHILFLHPGGIFEFLNCLLECKRVYVLRNCGCPQNERFNTQI